MSYEPALGPVDFTPWLGADCPECAGEHDLHWIVVGGESGSSARPFDVAWARRTVKACREAGVACFVKQLGANVRTRNDDNFTIDEDPPDPDWPSWPTNLVAGDRVEHNPDGVREEYQGAPVRVRLRDRKGGDMDEWPSDLRVRDYPEVRR